MRKIETHLHTKHVSKCGWLTAEELIAGYKAAGYDAIVVTDHYNRTTFDYLGIDPRAPGDKVGAFLEGYRRMAELGEREGIRVFKGAELRFDESENDYLLYGYRDDLLAEPEDIFRMGIAAFSPIARGQGALLALAGSDCHRREDIATTGILSEELPGDSFAMARLIRSRHYTLIGD